VARAPAVLLLLLAVVGCGGESERGSLELETETVPEPVDAGISLENDVQAKPPGEAVAGVLPGDFPPDFPVYSPASVVGFGPGFVELHSPVPPATVRAWLTAATARAGWAGSGPYSKQGRTVTVEVTASAGGTTLRFTY
jgi:hypothetical protein